jgi:hypothetical protein
LKYAKNDEQREKIKKALKGQEDAMSKAKQKSE